MFHQYHADIFWQIQRLPGYSSPSFFFFPGSHVQTPGSIVELVEHQRLDPLVVSGAAMQLRFPENWFKTSPCYGVMDQWYMFLIYVPFVMVIPVYGYDNHDICYDIICFLEIRSRRQGRRWWIEQLPRIVAWCWRTSWERHRKAHGTSVFFVISSPNPKLFQTKNMDVTKQIEKHIMLTSIKTSGK